MKNVNFNYCCMFKCHSEERHETNAACEKLGEPVLPLENPSIFNKLTMSECDLNLMGCLCRCSLTISIHNPKHMVILILKNVNNLVTMS